MPISNECEPISSVRCTISRGGGAPISMGVYLCQWVCTNIVGGAYQYPRVCGPISNGLCTNIIGGVFQYQRVRGPISDAMCANIKLMWTNFEAYVEQYQRGGVPISNGGVRTSVKGFFHQYQMVCGPTSKGVCTSIKGGVYQYHRVCGPIKKGGVHQYQKQFYAKY